MRFQGFSTGKILNSDLMHFGNSAATVMFFLVFFLGLFHARRFCGLEAVSDLVVCCILQRIGMSLPLARFVAGRSDNWSEEQRDSMESSREFSRNIINYIGWDANTQPLMEYWIAMTQVMVLESLGEEKAATIGPEGIGGYPIPSRKLVDLKKANPFMLQIMRNQIVAFEETVDLLYSSMDLFSYGDQDSESAMGLLMKVKDVVREVRSILDVSSSRE